MCLWYLGWKLGQAQNCSFWKPHFYQWSQFVKTGFRYSNHDLMAWCGIQCCLINNTALIIRKGLYCNHIQISNMDLRWFGSSVLSINFWAVWCSKNCIFQDVQTWPTLHAIILPENPKLRTWKKPNHPLFHHVKGFFDISMYNKISLWITITVVFRTPCRYCRCECCWLCSV